MSLDTAAKNITLHPQFPRIYEGYAYSYPHKSAYRRLSPPVPTSEAWRGTPRDSVSLYLHVPFCEMRCGFCNLFTTANPKETLVARYLDALERQAETVLEELGPLSVTQFVVGGGTPTYLTARELERIFGMAGRLFGVNPRHVPTSVETSPGTATSERIAALAAYKIDRISIGAQSFDEWERYAMGRPQKRTDLETALDKIRAHDFPVLNIDLIYGGANQTPESCRRSLRRALLWRPEEIHLYPLYVRPQTGLGGRVETWDAHRLALYRTGRDFLLGEGYEQLTMRCFRRADANLRDAGAEFGGDDAPPILGLGAGARSNTWEFHYSTHYAVNRRSILDILSAYCDAPANAFRSTDYGIPLDEEERLRRHVLATVLSTSGMDIARFLIRFALETVRDFAPLADLMDAGLLEEIAGRLRPTTEGLELSDAIGPWLYSPEVREYAVRQSSA
jgi:oxygen-independent coproporphyrinogen-3 oxidase